jgi:choline dehydrogenase-like flavoprotein
MSAAACSARCSRCNSRESVPRPAAEMGIPVIHDLPAVGSHLQDHFYVLFPCTRSITMNELANSTPRKVLAMAQYMLFRRGQLAANGVTAGTFARSDVRLVRPDLQFNFSPWSYASRDAPGAADGHRLRRAPGLGPFALLRRRRCDTSAFSLRLNRRPDQPASVIKLSSKKPVPRVIWNCRCA